MKLLAVIAFVANKSSDLVSFLCVYWFQKLSLHPTGQGIIYEAVYY
jgi:hypothetical protein